MNRGYNDPRCGNCLFREESFGTTVLEGFCKRHAPGISPDENYSHGHATWPVVNHYDWCGDYQITLG